MFGKNKNAQPITMTRFSDLQDLSERPEKPADDLLPEVPALKTWRIDMFGDMSDFKGTNIEMSDRWLMITRITEYRWRWIYPSQTWKASPVSHIVSVTNLNSIRGWSLVEGE